MRYLITGISGFVAGHYLEYIFSKNHTIKVIGLDIKEPSLDFIDKKYKKRIIFFKRKLQDKNFLIKIIKKYKPDFVIHFASFSSVAESWHKPQKCFLNNINIFLNLVEALKIAHSKAKILSIGSSEEYGVVSKKDLPLRENNPLNPSNPYSVSRVSQEQISRLYAKGYGLNIICTRSFNHLGPRQSDRFVISSLVRQLVEMKGKKKKVICGNLDIIRDFIDVRDVIRAYDLLLAKGKAGEVYNVCSGEGVRIKEILDMLKKELKINPVVQIDKKLIRPVDNPIIIGSPAKLQKQTAFKPKYNLYMSLKDIIKWWDRRIG